MKQHWHFETMARLYYEQDTYSPEALFSSRLMSDSSWVEPQATVRLGIGKTGQLRIQISREIDQNMKQRSI